MVAIISSNGLGLQQSAAYVLGGGYGTLGQATVGRGGENLYVNAYNGNLVVNRTDEMLFGLGLDSSIGRTYNSQTQSLTGIDANDGDNNDGWRASFSKRIVLVGTVDLANLKNGDQLKRVDGDGSILVFNYVANYDNGDGSLGAFLCKHGDGAHETIRYKTATGQLEWLEGDSGIRETYELSASSYRLKVREDIDGNKLSYRYNGELVDRVTTQNGEYTDIKYVGSNIDRLETFHGAGQKVTRVQYGYDGNRLTSITVDLSPDDNSVAAGRKYVTNYGYDTQGRIISMTQDDGSAVSVTYHPDGRVHKYIQTSSAGVTRSMTFAYYSGYTTVTDPAGKVTTLSYDAQGRLTTVSRPDADDVGPASPQVFSFTYVTDSDEVLSISQGGTNVVTYEYDDHGNRKLERDAAGNTVRRYYNAKNQLLTEIHYATPDADGPGSGQAGEPQITRYTYDDEGHLRFVVSPEGRVTEHRYATAGQPLKTIQYLWPTMITPTGMSENATFAEADFTTYVSTNDYRSTLTEYSYDFRGNLASTRVWASVDSNGAGVGESIYTQFIYDQSGQLRQKIVEAEPGVYRSESYLYDGLGRLTSFSDFYGHLTAYDYQDGIRSTVVTLANGLIQTSVFNHAGELLSFYDSVSGPEAPIRSHTYDSRGRLRTTTDATGVKSWMFYDNLNRLVALVDSDRSVVEYKYHDSNDKLATTIRYKNLTGAALALLDGETTTIVDIRPAPDADGDRWEWNFYDAAHRLSATVDAAGYVTTFAYDGASRLLTTRAYATPVAVSDYKSSSSAPPTSSPTITPAATDRISRNFYDKDGLLKGTLDGEGYLTELFYDAAGRTADTVRYANPSTADRAVGTWDQLKAGITLDALRDRRTYFIYDGRGLLHAEINGERELTRYQYDARGHRSQVKRGQVLTSDDLTTLLNSARTPANLPTPTTEVIDTTDYSYDLYGNLKSETRQVRNSAGALVSETDSYSYDEMRRLVSVTRNSVGVDARTVTYRYDLRGRLVGVVKGEGSLLIPISTEGSASGETLNGSAAANWLKGQGGGDTINGLGGADALEGGDGNDILDGGAGIDGMSGGNGDDVFYVDDAGDTTVEGVDQGADHVFSSISYALAADQWIEYLSTINMASTSAINLAGNNRNNTINGNAGANALFGGAGSDILVGNGGDDWLIGGIGDDTLTGGAGADLYVFAPGDGADTINDFDVANDRIDLRAFGGATYSVSDVGGNAVLQIGSWQVTVIGRTAAQLAGRIIIGGSGAGFDQVITGTALGQTHNGSAGHDWILGAGGGDTINGLDGNDKLEGGPGTDTLNGGDGNDYLLGGEDADVISGGNGNDIIVGGAAADTTLSGGAGADWFVFAVGDRGTGKITSDVITDFTVGVDMIDLSAITAGNLTLMQAGAHVVITKGFHLEVTVLNTTVAALANSFGTAPAWTPAPTPPAPPSPPVAPKVAFGLSVADVAFATHGTRYVYDSADRLIAKYEPNGTDTDGHRTLYYYNTDGKLVYEIDPLGRTIEYLYNSFGEVSGTSLHANAVAATNLATMTGGLVTAAVDAAVVDDPDADSITSTTYNLTGTVKVHTDARGSTTEYTYNGFREWLTSTTLLNSLATPDQTRVTTRLIDERGLIESQTIKDGFTAETRKTEFVYDAFGGVTRVTDPKGRIRSTGYDRAGRVISTTDAFGWETKYYHDGRGNLIRRVDPNSNETTFKYTEHGRKIEVTTPELIVSSSEVNSFGQTVKVIDGEGRWTAYAYDRNGNLKTTSSALGSSSNNYDEAGRLEEVVDARGFKTRYEYDAANRVLTRTVDHGGLNLVTAYSYDAKGQQLSVTDPSGTVTTYEYSKGGDQTRITVDPTGLKLVTEYTYDEAGRTLTLAEGVTGATAQRLTRYSYNAYNELKSVEVDPNGLDLTTSYTFDKNGNAVSKTDPNGNITRYFYDNENQLTWTVDPTGAVTRNIYTKTGKLESVRAYANKVAAATLATWPLEIPYASLITAAVATSASDQVSTYYYDKDDRLRFSLDSYRRPTEFVYDKAGNVVRRIEHAGTVLSADDTATKIEARLAALAQSVKDQARTTRAVFDAANRQVYSINAMGGVVQYVYDPSGNTVKQIRYADLYTASGDKSQIVMDDWADDLPQSGNSANRISRSVFDGAGRAVYSVDAEGYVTKFVYDADGSVVEEHRYAASYAVSDGMTPNAVAALIGAPSPAAIVTKKYGYDTAGRLVDSWDAINVRTHLGLDKLGQITDVYRAYGHPTDQSQVTRVYDAAGRVTNETRGVDDVNPATTTWSYDGAGRVLVETRGAGSSPATTTYTYDAEGRVLTETVQLTGSADAVTTKEYDAFGNLVKVTDANLDGQQGTGYFYYDKLNRVTLQIDPERYATATVYSLGGEVTQVTRHYTRVTSPGVGTPPAITPHAKDAVTRFERDKLDRVTKVMDAEWTSASPAGHFELYVLNAFGDRTSVTNKLGGTTLNVFDRRGLLIQETLPVNSVDHLGSSKGAVVNKYEYDARGNRTRSIEAFGLDEANVTEFVYDKNDRLVEKKGEAVTVTDPTTFGTSNSVPKETLVYDARGNVIQTTRPDGAKTFFYYDELDRKVAELDAMGTLRAWTYDDRNNAVAERVYGVAVTIPSAPGGTPPTAPTDYRETLHYYDLNNRLIESKVVGLRFGSYGSAYTSVIGDLRTLYTYDRMGNVVRKQTLAGGAEVSDEYTYYDKLGRKVAQIDSMRYFTWYVLDGEGNVTREERYANQVWESLDPATDPAVYRAEADDGDARVTEFTYDRNGRRLTETRLGVLATSIDGTGTMAPAAPTDIQVKYEYNGLGQVTRKYEGHKVGTVATEYTDYGYDVLGRKTSETTSSFIDHTGATVERRTDIFYNGLGSVTRQVVRDLEDTTGADWRITRYQYGNGGRLTSMTDASGFVRNYGYDIAGRVIMERFELDIAGTSANHDQILKYGYDALGRLTLQTAARRPSTSWIYGDANQTQYNAYGEISAKGVNGMWQETFAYDKGGRLWRSTAGDGVVRLFVSDGLGNATLTFSSNGGADQLGTHTDLEAALATLDDPGAIGTVDLAGQSVVMTINLFDRRGQNIGSREPFRQLTVGGAANDTLVRGRTYNAYGEVTSETNARGYTTHFYYNSMGRLIERKNPLVNYTEENGAVVVDQRVSEFYHYDTVGRLIGVTDANGKLNKRQVLTGSGLDGADPIVIAEFNADTTVSKTGVDVFGNERRFSVWSGGVEQAGVETRTYDKMGRVVSVTHPLRTGGVQLIDTYLYDGLGQRIQHDNNVAGLDAEETDYDVQGRVSRFKDFGGRATTYAYAWDGAMATNLATGTLGTFGGWVKTTVNTAGLTSTERQDYFGRVVERTDFGAHTYVSTFDKAGRLVSEFTGGAGKSFTYFNTGLVKTTSDNSAGDPIYSTTVVTEYGYDANGNRTAEKHSGTYFEAGQWKTYVHQNATATWDALDRLSTFQDLGYSGVWNAEHRGGGAATATYQYDKKGNVRRIVSTFIDPIDYTQKTSDFWYKYDSMDRFTVTMGELKNGAIERGTTGTAITYDAFGRRATAISTNYQSGDHREKYNYTEDGYLLTVQMGDGVPPTDVRASYVRDAIGRLVDYFEYKWVNNGTQLVQSYHRNAVYNSSSELTNDTITIRKDGGGERITENFYYYNAETTAWNFNGAYMGGVVTGQVSQISDDPDTRMKTEYEWYSSAQELKITYDKDIGNTGNNLWVTDYYRTTSGRLVYVDIDDGADRQIVYTTDASGQILTRRQKGGSEDTKPVNYYYYFDGLRVGEITNKRIEDRDYAQTINKRWSGTTHNTRTWADFDQSYDPTHPDTEKSVGGSYVVRNGDTLQSIAQDVWGDSSLWYLIADTNGMDGTEALVAGQSLALPAKVANVHNSADTFRPYNPNEAIGKNLPVKPKPQDQKCGPAMIIVAIVAVVVAALVMPHAVAAISNVMTAGSTVTGSAVTAGFQAAAAAGSTSVSAATVAGSALSSVTLSTTAIVGGSAVAGAAGSIASQLVGMALRVQDKFDWKGVAISALAAGLTVGMGKIPGTGWMNSVPGGQIGSQVVKAASANVLTQGVSVATGLQDKFSWGDVAVASVGAAVAGSVRGGVGKLIPDARLAAGGASLVGGVIGVGVRSLIEGSSFGDNLQSALPSIIGNTIGETIAVGIAEAQKKHAAVEIGVKEFVTLHPDAKKEHIEAVRTQAGELYDASVAAGRPRGLFESEADYKSRRSGAETTINLISRARVALGAAADGKTLTDAMISEAIAASRQGYDPSKYPAGAVVMSQSDEDVPLDYGDGVASEVIVTGYRNEHLPEDDGGRPALLSRRVDQAVNIVGDKAMRIAPAIEEKWYLRYGLEAAGVIADGVTMYYGGPARFVISKALDAGEGKLVSSGGELVGRRFTDVGYDPNTSAMAGAGAGTLLQLGLSAKDLVDTVRSLPSFVRNLAIKLDPGVRPHADPNTLGSNGFNGRLRADFGAFSRSYPDLKLSEAEFSDLTRRLPDAAAHPNELAGAARYERQSGVVLRQGPEGGIDFYYMRDGRRVEVEHMGSLSGLGLDATNRNPRRFGESAYQHVQKSADEVIIDVTGLDKRHLPGIEAQVRQGLLDAARPGRIDPEVIWIGR